MALYEIHVTSKDHIGMNFLENVIELANKGATQKEGTIPMMRFPFNAKMVIETEDEPEASPHMRVFNMSEGAREISIIKPEAATGFSFDLGTKTKMTKEDIDALEWKEFKDACKAAGFGGRDRAQMTKKLLEFQESQE